MTRRFFVGGNFKMLSKLVENLNSADLDPNVEVVIAPPAIYILPLKNAITKSNVAVAAQNAYKNKEGAFTGEVSPWQLAQESIPWVILGHSERRSIFKESDDEVAVKTIEALEAGLSVIFCVGETLQEREANQTDAVVKRQLQALIDKKPDWSKVVIAYEPVWSIGTGKTATPAQAQEVHASIRAFLGTAGPTTRIIYGGSVNAKNAAELAAEPDIDGSLVGGASLKPEFITVINCQRK